MWFKFIVDLLFFSGPSIPELNITDIETKTFTVRLPQDSEDFTDWNMNVLNKTNDTVFNHNYTKDNLSVIVQAEGRIVSGSKFTVYVQTFSYGQAGKTVQKSIWTSKYPFFSTYLFLYAIQPSSLFLTSTDFKI